MKVTIYTRTTCAYCVQVKKLLEMKGQEYSVINLDEDKAAETYILEKSGMRNVPIVTVTRDNTEEEVVSVGWNPAALLKAIA